MFSLSNYLKTLKVFHLFKLMDNLNLWIILIIIGQVSGKWSVADWRGVMGPESENEPNRIELKRFGSVWVDPNRTRTAFLKIQSNRTEPEPVFQKWSRTEPNSNRLLEKKTNRTELEPEKVGSIRSLLPTHAFLEKRWEQMWEKETRTSVYVAFYLLRTSRTAILYFSLLFSSV